MKIKLLLLAPLPIVLFFGVKAIVSLFVFNEGIAITDQEYAAVKKIAVNYKGDPKKEMSQKDLTINFTYEYPFVDFHGHLLIQDQTIRSNDSIGRTLYSGTYQRSIMIKNICYDPTFSSADSMALNFMLISRNRIYSWNSFERLNIAPYRKLKVLLMYDDRVDARRAVVRPEG